MKRILILSIVVLGLASCGQAPTDEIFFLTDCVLEEENLYTSNPSYKYSCKGEENDRYNYIVYKIDTKPIEN